MKINLQNNPYIFFFKKMREYSDDKKIVVKIMLYGFLAQVVWLLHPYFLGMVINTIQEQGVLGWNYILLYLIALFFLGIVGRYFHGYSRVWEELQSFTLGEKYLTGLFHKINALGMEWHTDNHSGKTIDKTSKATNALKGFVGGSFLYFGTPVQWIGAIISLLFLWWPGAVIMVVTGVINVLIINKFDKNIIGYIKEKNQKEHSVMSTLFDFIANIKTVITLRSEHVAIKAVNKMIKEVYPSFKKRRVTEEFKWFTMSRVIDVFLLLIVGLYIYIQFSVHGTVLIGTLTMIYQYCKKIEGAFNRFTRQYSGLIRMKTDMESADDIEEAYKNISAEKERFMCDISGDIHIKDMNFGYNDDPVVKKCSLLLKPGQKTALVGTSGSGKSTIMALLRGLYKPSNVTCIVNGKKYDTLDCINDHASLIPQDPEIFENTIKYNITMGLQFDDQTIKKYVSMAAFTDVLKNLPEGLDTDIKEKGVNLSGGQKQRLALARGLLMAEESGLILLDESTSSVDSVNEKNIYEDIFAYYNDRYIVASIHKLHLLELFDNIIVLEKGEIVEEGSFADLVKKKGGKLATMRKEYTVETSKK